MTLGLDGSGSHYVFLNAVCASVSTSWYATTVRSNWNDAFIFIPFFESNYTVVPPVRILTFWKKLYPASLLT